jgi:putative polyhydroxyalkanoate system protein
MSTITVRHSHSLGRAEARRRVDAFEETLKKYNVSLLWNGDRAEMKGFGVTGGALVTDSLVEITLKLGMMAKAAGVDPVKLEASLKKRLAAAFGDPAAPPEG